MGQISDIISPRAEAEPRLYTQRPNKVLASTVLSLPNLGSPGLARVMLQFSMGTQSQSMLCP